jgi:PadR family transcriptional regulator, regulatory protein PadR
VKDINEAKDNFQKGLYTGIAELLLLGVVNRSQKPIYGYQIAKMVEMEGEGMPVIKLGTLYPILRSLQADGFLESQVDPSVTGPPRRYYTITPQGRQVLKELTKSWENTKTFVDDILKGDHDDQQRE